jgi:predicted nucleic acid-binding protein
MSGILVDTSAWVDLLNHRAVMPIAVGRRRLAASSFVLAELASLAAQGRVPPAVSEEVRAVARLEPATLADFTFGGELHGRLRGQGNSKVSLTDCIAYASSVRLGMPFLTRDHDLEGQPGVIRF